MSPKVKKQTHRRESMSLVLQEDNKSTDLPSGDTASHDPFKFGHLGKPCCRVLCNHSTREQKLPSSKQQLAQHLEQLHCKEGFANQVLQVL